MRVDRTWQTRDDGFGSPKRVRKTLETETASASLQRPPPIFGKLDFLKLLAENGRDGAAADRCSTTCRPVSLIEVVGRGVTIADVEGHLLEQRRAKNTLPTPSLTATPFV